MRTPKVLFALCALVLVLASTGCYYDVETELYPDSFCDSSVTTYSAAVLPIIQSNCATPGCHVAGGTGTGDFTTYDGVRSQIVSGRLIPSIRQDPGAIPMPPTGKLSKCDIGKIERWVNNGGQNN